MALSSLKQNGLVRSVVRTARAARRPRALVEARRIRAEFVRGYLGDPHALETYEREVRASGLMAHLRERAREHHALVSGGDGAGYSLGAIGYAEGVYLYAILRRLRPRVAVETGVANGFSTAFALLALDANGTGELHSVDLPRELGRDYAPGEFYEGTGRAGIPPGAEPGWLIPERLKERWHLILGRSQDALPPLLDRLGAIDSFMHDSEHSFDCMWFEYHRAWPALRQGGVLLSDDVNSTEAFPRFAAEVARRPIRIARGMAFVVK